MLKMEKKLLASFFNSSPRYHKPFFPPFFSSNHACCNKCESHVIFFRPLISLGKENGKKSILEATFFLSFHLLPRESHWKTFKKVFKKKFELSLKKAWKGSFYLDLTEYLRSFCDSWHAQCGIHKYIVSRKSRVVANYKFVYLNNTTTTQNGETFSTFFPLYNFISFFFCCLKSPFDVYVNCRARKAPKIFLRFCFHRVEYCMCWEGSAFKRNVAIIG